MNYGFGGGVALKERPPSSTYERLAERLTPYLGQLNARVWVKVVAERELGMSPHDLSGEDVQAVIDGLRPSLNTFMGRGAAEELLGRIGREVT